LRIYRTNDAPAALSRAISTACWKPTSLPERGQRRRLEWFITSSRFLGEIARVLRLPIEAINDDNILSED
jgi:hypothetical protein